MPPRDRFPRWALVGTAVLVAATVGWMLIGIPTFVKYPTDLDVAPRYEGTFTLFVDPTTAAPLDTPIEVPLVVERRIRALEDESGSSRVVVEETIDQQAGELFEATQTNVYVMDRSTLENVADPRAFAYTPDNVVDRSGAYRLNLPFDVDPVETHDIYKNEIAGTYAMTGTGEPATTVAGLELTPFAATVDEAPMSDAYLAELDAVVPLPSELTFEQLRPHLLAAGIDVDAVLAALAPVITESDLATLVDATGDPIPLDYVVAFEGRAGVERTTGAEVDVGAVERIGARPDLSGAAALRDVLAGYPDVPEAADAVESLDALVAGPPVALFEYRYDQTDASVAEVAGTVSDLRDEVRLARVWLPLALVALTALVLLAGVVVWVLRRRRGAAPPSDPIDLRTADERTVEARPPVPATLGRSEDRRA